MSLSGPGMVFPLRRPEFALCFRGHSGVTHLLIGSFFPANPVLPSSFGYRKVRIQPRGRIVSSRLGGGTRAVHLLVIVYIR